MQFHYREKYEKWNPVFCDECSHKRVFIIPKDKITKYPEIIRNLSSKRCLFVVKNSGKHF